MSKFDFQTSGYGLIAFAAATDGTANPQNVIAPDAGYVRGVNPLDLAGFYVEPAQCRTIGQPDLNAVTTLLLWVERVGTATGDWTFDFSFARTPGAVSGGLVSVATGVVAQADQWTASEAPTVVEGVFPADFFKDPTGAVVEDVLNFNLEVTPAGAHTAELVWVFGMVLPTNVAGAIGNHASGLPGGVGQAVGAIIR